MFSLPNMDRTPLARRMTPETLDEVLGQEAILAKGKLLRRMIEADRLRSIILYGPPGTGKTSLARVIARHTRSKFRSVNAVSSGVADLKRIIEDSRNPILTPEGRSLLFIDEIHRFNKAQQDLLLPYVEEGDLILIGATTENPFFEVNKALISRSTVFQLKALGQDAILQILERAVHDKRRGLGLLPLQLEPGALAFLADFANGDARIALNALELAALTTEHSGDGNIPISIAALGDCIQRRSLAYDKNGDGHYDNISAFIKSMRGSDPDAALYYLARALHSGEAPEFLARRIVICAAEDVGLANPNALLIAVAAADAAMQLGMPEARIPLAEATIAVATSPKSNSAYLAIDAALADVRANDGGEIPPHIRNAVTKGMAELGIGKGYLYPHDFPRHLVRQDYLPESVRARAPRFYVAQEEGYEKRIKAWLEEKDAFLEHRGEHRPDSPGQPERSDGSSSYGAV